MPVPAFFSSAFRWITARRINVIASLVVAAGVIAAVSIFATGFEGTGRDCPQPIKDWVRIHGWYDYNTYNCAPNFNPDDKLTGTTEYPVPDPYDNPLVAYQPYHTFNEFIRFIHSVQTPNPEHGAIELVTQAVRLLPADQFQAWYAGNNFIPVGFNDGIPEGYSVVAPGGAVQFINGAQLNQIIDVGIPQGQVPGGWHRSAKRDTYFVFVWNGRVNENGNVRFACSNIRVTAVTPATPQTPLPELAGSLKLHKFEDTNGNGVQEAGEPPLPGVTITTTGPNNYTNTSQTDAAGNITLTTLGAGNYTSTQQVPEGYKVTTSNPQTGSVTGTQTVTLNFGDQKIPPAPGNLKLHKFEDLNGNGQQDAGEPALGGVTLTTTGPGNYSNTSRTDAAGNVTLNSLPPGSYTATQQVPGGYTVTTANPQSGTVVSNQTVTLNFGDQKVPPPAPQTGNLKLHKFEDQNGNGAQDAGEPALASITLTTTGPGNYSNTSQTDASGNVTLDNLTPGSYTATQQVPDGYKVTTPNPQNGNVVANQTTVLNFGDQKTPPGNLKLHKFEDLNGNGQEDAGEPPLPNVTLTTTGPNNYNNTSKTDSGGNISLNSLPPGSYTSTQQVPDGYKVTTPNPQSGTVISNQTTTLNFGDQKSCTRQGVLNIHAFIDSNKDGQQQLDEAGLAETTFTVTSLSGSTITTAKTDQNGNVGVNLPHGTYSVSQNAREGYVPTNNAQAVTMVDCQTNVAVFVNRLNPEPGPLPSGAPSPSPAPAASPHPQATPGTPVTTPAVGGNPPVNPPNNGGSGPGNVFKGFSELPKTGQALIVIVLTILLVGGAYYGERFLARRHRSSK